MKSVKSIDVLGDRFRADEGYRRPMLLEEGVPDTRLRGRNPTKENQEPQASGREATQRQKRLVVWRSRPE